MAGPFDNFFDWLGGWGNQNNQNNQNSNLTTTDPIYEDVVPQVALPRVTKTNSNIDPLTGRAIDTSGMGKEIQGAADAYIARGLATDVLSDERRLEAIAGLQGLSDSISGQLLNPGNTGDLEALGRSLFARGADAASNQALAVSRQVSGSLGGRGISASSGVAAGLAQMIDLQRSAQTRATERDVRIELLRRSAENQLQAFNVQQGLGRDIANLTAQVPTYGLDAIQGLAETIAEIKYANQARKDGKKSGLLDTVGGIVKGITSII